MTGLLINGSIAARTTGNPTAALEVARAAVRQERLLEVLAAANRKPDPDNYAHPAAAAVAGAAAASFTRDHLDEQLAAARAEAVPRVNAWFAAVSAVVLVGGLCVLFGRFYPLALLGCVAAILNLNHMCFAPGLVVGIWGLLMLARDDVRPYFRHVSG